MVILLAMAAAGVVGGVAWILVPTLARAYAGVNELITTLLLNFVATLLVSYVATGPWRDRQTLAQASTGRIAVEVPSLWGEVHWGLPVAVLLAVVLAAIFATTRWGYEVRISGANPNAAAYAGIPVRARIIAVMLLSGGIAGLAGMLEVAGNRPPAAGRPVQQLRLSRHHGGRAGERLVPGRAGRAALMAVILNAGTILQTQGLNTSTVLAITGLILFLTAIGDEAAHYRRVAVDRT